MASAPTGRGAAVHVLLAYGASFFSTCAKMSEAGNMGGYNSSDHWKLRRRSRQGEDRLDGCVTNDQNVGVVLHRAHVSSSSASIRDASVLRTTARACCKMC